MAAYNRIRVISVSGSTTLFTPSQARLCIEASRLSRSSRDWAHLFEMCGYFDTLVADLQQVYDVAIPNDRLVLQIPPSSAS